MRVIYYLLGYINADDVFSQESEVKPPQEPEGPVSPELEPTLPTEPKDVSSSLEPENVSPQELGDDSFNESENVLSQESKKEKPESETKDNEEITSVISSSRPIAAEEDTPIKPNPTIQEQPIFKDDEKNEHPIFMDEEENEQSLDEYFYGLLTLPKNTVLTEEYLE